APVSAPRLLESMALGELIHGWARDYDLTVIDGPDPMSVADAIPIAKQVDAVVIVARMARDTGPGVRRLRTELQRLGIEPLGVVATFAGTTRGPQQP
ncbi:MAG: hypothetical protein ACRDL5_11045, partial [Solirubrobacteraceae bacterium]